ncbi:MAG: enoyl-CoA hydratase-related protein [bacterium]|nr:enoyl-CoA hydratase-related protein [bacterium]
MAEKKDRILMNSKNGLGSLRIDSNDSNSLTMDTIVELGHKFELLEVDPNVRAIVITGYPKSFFSAGADIVEINELVKTGDRNKAVEILVSLGSVFSRIDNCSKPVIAAINGYCLGGGLELALACDFRIANKEAMLGLPEIDLGIFPGLGGTQRLPRLIGVSNALKVILGGKRAIMPAHLAREKGLVDEIITDDFAGGIKKFVEQVLSGARVSNLGLRNQQSDFPERETFKDLVAEKSKSAVDSIFHVIKTGLGVNLAEGLAIERESFIDQALSPDGREGVGAYIEKRTPRFNNSSGQNVDSQSPVNQNELGQLTEEYAMLRQTLKEFCQKEIKPRVDEMEKAGNIFPEIIQQMAELGLFGIPFPDTYGGSGLGKTGYCIMMEELCRVHGSMAVLVGASVGLTGGSIYLFGTEVQKQKYLRSIAEGKSIGAFALTEAEAGSDAANLMSVAEKRGNAWIINGTKQFISNGDIADVIVVFAKTDKDLGANGITAFIVEKNYVGLRTTKVEHKMGIRASRTTSMEFTDMVVPEENVLGRLGQGFKIAMETLNLGRLSLAAGCLGASKRAFELAYTHASQRSQMGKKLLEFQMTQSSFAQMRSHIFLMEQSIYNVAAKADRGEDIRLESAIVKLTASEMSEWDIRKALQIHGGLGYMDEYEISRLMRDSIINTIFEGANEIQQLLIFKEIFKSGGKI